MTQNKTIPKKKIFQLLKIPTKSVAKSFCLKLTGVHPLKDELLTGLATLPLTVVTDTPTTIDGIYYLTPEKLDQVTAGFDAVFIFPNEQLVKQVIDARKNDIVPIVPHHPNLHQVVKDWNPVEEQGNGFVYSKSTIWGMFAAVVRALENYQFPYDWQNLIRHGREI